MSRSRLAGLALLVLTTGCAPSVAPLYRDYEVRPTGVAAAASGEVTDDQTFARLRAALADAGWQEAPADAPNVIATAPRTLSNWGFSRTELHLDLAPIGGRHVRVFFHPYRYGLLGGPSKVPYLTGSVRRAVLPELNEALERQGFVVLGTPHERDEETVDG